MSGLWQAYHGPESRPIHRARRGETSGVSVSKYLDNLKGQVTITEDAGGRVHVNAGPVKLWFRDRGCLCEFTWCLADYILSKEKPERGIPDSIREAFEQ